MRFCLFIILIYSFSFCQTSDTLKQAISLDTLPQKSISSADTLPNKDSIKTSPDSYNITSDSLLYKNKHSKNSADSLEQKIQDSLAMLVIKGNYIGASIGWSLGGNEAVKLWETALPDSLGDFNLTQKTGFIMPDTNATDSLMRLGDTSHLRVSIKEKPNMYNMTFPIAIHFSRFRDKDQFSASLSFAYLSKTQKGSVYVLNDSIDRRIDFRKQLSMYTVTLYALYGIKIDPMYFSVDQVDRTNVFLGFGVSPLVTINNYTKLSKKGNDPRLQIISDSMRSSYKNSSGFGLSLSIRTGISTIKSINRGKLEFGLFYNLGWFNYFYDNNKRVYRNALNPADNDAHKPLSFVTNRVEFTIGVLRSASGKSSLR
jgi:hypothetical protein